MLFSVLSGKRNGYFFSWVPLSIRYSSAQPIRKLRSKLRLEVMISVSHPLKSPHLNEQQEWRRRKSACESGKSTQGQQISQPEAVQKVSIHNNRKPDLWAELVRLREEAWKWWACSLWQWADSLWQTEKANPLPTLSLRSTGQCSPTCCAGRILFVTGWLQGTIIYFESFCLGRTQSQHFSYVLVKETLPTSGGYYNKGAILGETPILNQVYYKDSKVERGLQRWNQKPENSQG